jgi:hypothetical protein
LIREHFVSDIFQEVDEEVRREQLKKLWDKYQTLIVAGVLLVLAAVAGWRGYDYWQTKKAAEFGTAFEEAATLAEQNKHAEAEAAFAKISTDGTAGYRSLARLRGAAEAAAQDPKKGIAAYEQIAGDSSAGQVLQDLAALRAGALMIDQGSFDPARARLEPLVGADRAFRHSARELLALAAWRAGDTTGARKWFDMILTDAQTPASTRSRVEMLIALVDEQGKS